MKGELTEKQKSFLYRAAELEKVDMVIMATPGFQSAMADKLCKEGYLREAGWASNEETGHQDLSWRITTKGLEASGYSYPHPLRGCRPVSP